VLTPPLVKISKPRPVVSNRGPTVFTVPALGLAVLTRLSVPGRCKQRGAGAGVVVGKSIRGLDEARFVPAFASPTGHATNGPSLVVAPPAKLIRKFWTSVDKSRAVGHRVKVDAR
jgi:hypothetical protein